MKLIRPPIGYANVEAFYAEVPDIDRRLSEEVDYGSDWFEPYATAAPKYRLSFVCNTGELYEVNLGPSEAEGRVRLVATFASHDECEWALEDWEEMCLRGGLRWLRDRLEHSCVKYVCVHCVQWKLQGDFTFDSEDKCRTCNKKQWVVDPTHERDRRRRPNEAAKESA